MDGFKHRIDQFPIQSETIADSNMVGKDLFPTIHLNHSHIVDAASIVASLMITYRPSPVSSQCQEVPSVGAAGTE